MGEEELHQLVGGCLKQDRKSQKTLYKVFYGFAMGIFLRYAGNRDQAAEVMNQGTQSGYSKGQYRIRFTISRIFDFNHKNPYK